MSARKVETYQVEDGWIETSTGRQFHFADPQPDEIDIRDIAHALSLLCRYNGHTRRFYSVAEHCVVIAEWLEAHNYGGEVALTGLLHDAAEAYIGDMPRPIKVTLPGFIAMEKVIDVAVAKKFNTTFPFHPIIKELDTKILVDERQQMIYPSSNEWGTDGIEPIGVSLYGWSPEVAEEAFLQTFVELEVKIADGN